MAIKPTTFYQRFYTKTVVIGCFLQLLIATILFGWWYVAPAFGFSHTEPLLFFVAPFLVLEFTAVAFFSSLMTEPIKVLTDAITHASDSSNTEVPIPINEARFVKSGLKDVITTIYELANHPHAPSGKKDKNTIFKEIFNQLPIGVIVLNAERTIVHANSAAPVQKNAVTLRNLDLNFGAQDSVATWLDQSEEHDITTTRTWSRIAEKTDNQSRRFFDVIASYHKNGTQGVETVIMTIDRSAQYAPDEENMDFIALAAHELRGPITVIRGYLDVFSEELAQQLTDDQKALMDRLSVSANRLSGYVNNILNASRYDHRHLKLYLYEQRPEDLYQAVADDLALRARTLHRFLATDMPHDLPTVAADKTSIGEVIVNLVDNAIKYSNEGGQVVVSARVEGDFVEFSVRDTGIGIPAPILQKLFTKFYRSHRSRETATGSGLGLYISKAIVESHGGTISVRSTEGHGSTFTFTLPVYKTVADILRASNNSNEGIIESSNGWIRNHAMYRG